MASTNVSSREGSSEPAEQPTGSSKSRISREKLPPIRAAYLYQDNVLLILIQAFFDALRLTLGMEASRRFLKDSTEFEAVNWLTQKDEDE